MPMLALGWMSMYIPLKPIRSYYEEKMKKTITIICITLSLLIILDSFNFAQALVMFLLAGVIPGTNIAIDGARMLEFFSLAIGFTVGRVMMYGLRTFKLRLTSISQVRA